MRGNKYGVRGLSSVHLERGLVYFWVPPVSLQRAGIFKRKYLGRDFRAAVDKACDWNVKLDAYRVSIHGVKLTLNNIAPGTVGHLVRQFEVSPRYARYSYRTRQDYSWMYRSTEVQTLDDDQMFGERRASKVTRQLAYTLYEKNVVIRGNDSEIRPCLLGQLPFGTDCSNIPRLAPIRLQTSISFHPLRDVSAGPTISSTASSRRRRSSAFRRLVAAP